MESIAFNRELSERDLAEFWQGDHVAFDLHIPLAFPFIQKNLIHQRSVCTILRPRVVPVIEMRLPLLLHTRECLQISGSQISSREKSRLERGLQAGARSRSGPRRDRPSRLRARSTAR